MSASRDLQRGSILLALLAGSVALCEQPPGVVINHIPAQSQVYVGSPGIAVLPDGDYLAKHDEFGPKSTEHGDAIRPGWEASSAAGWRATRPYRRRDAS
ncbi:MAG TPA: hypothetical protein VLI39_08645 [Sedimentisphaerales bacterium]|nr:hypothetical protein [Sedimentisphaerales bacterium]